MRVRPATVEDVTAVLGVLDGAMLATDREAVRDRAAAGDVLVAVAGESGDRVLGTCVLDTDGTGAVHVEAVAVRRRRRGQGIGTALLEGAAERVAGRGRAGRLTADFDADVRPFYESLGFDVRAAGEGRCRGVLAVTDGDDRGGQERQG